jgi:hypothetical protein
MLIIQIEKEVYFMDIKKLKKLSMLSKDYCFYERNKKLKDNHKLKKGIHYIQYRCSLKGGLNTAIIIINDTQIPINISNNTLT